jgi:VWFA-related protein
MARSRLLLFTLALFALPARSLFAQTSPAVSPADPFTLTLHARTVVVDVVVKDRKGQAVPGLRKEDFQVFENGKPQAITFFEPNFAKVDAVAAPVPVLPADNFTNISVAPPNQVTNVFLLDALNTRPDDRMYAQVQLVKYLASLPPNLRVGIFTLTYERFRMVWGFNQDSSALRAAIEQFSSREPATSLLAARIQQQELTTTLDALKQKANATKDTRLARSADALQDFLRHGTGIHEEFDNILTTFNALQALAHYLAGIPGRKNLYWLVADFPRCNKDSGFSELYDETKDMLAAAGVSVYPIDVHGVDADVDPLAGHRFIDTETWAEETGGKAYHANRIDQEIADAVDHGSRYYSLAYVPGETKEEGRERRIEVKVLSGNYSVFYRKRYFEQTQREVARAGTVPAKSPLLALMGRGMPNIGEIPYTLKVIPSATQPSAGTPQAGQNAQLAGKLTRYGAIFRLPVSGLSLLPDADGVRRKTLEVALMVYSQDGKPLNWVVGNIPVQIKPEQWVRDQRDGIPFHFEIDAPAGDVYLRTGVYDSSTSKVGTLEIPLSAVSEAKR